MLVPPVSAPSARAPSLTRTAARLAPGWPLLVLAAVLVLAAAFQLPDRRIGLVLLAVAGGIGAAAALVLGLARLSAGRQSAVPRDLAGWLAEDPVAVVVTDLAGRVQWRNAAALRLVPGEVGLLSVALAEVAANSAATLGRLATRAISGGQARGEFIARRGGLRVAVHRSGEGLLLWRIEETAERPALMRPAEMALPHFVAARSGTVLYMNEAMRRLVGVRARTLEAIFAEMPPRSGEEQDILTTEGRQRALVAELPGTGGRRDFYLLPGALVPRPASDPASFEALPVALMRLSGESEVLAVNRAARALIGAVDHGTRFSELFEGLGRPLEDWIADALQGRADRRSEVMRARLPGREIFLQVTLARFVDGGRVGLVAVLADATQIKTLEAQIVQSQKMQAIGQLAGGVAHDFNNLLTAISGHCDLLMLRHDKGDPDFADLDQISQNANRAAALVGQLLAFSRKQTLTLRRIDLRETLADLMHLLNRLVGEKISLTFEHDPNLPAVRADRRQIEQVLMNLVVNARDAMPEGGEIRVETRGETLDQPLLRDKATVLPGDYAVVRVIDQGVGMPPDVLDKIFEPFFTTKRAGEGTGLGLSTAYGIVKQSGGFIFCDSAPGQGTTFTLYFPVHAHSGTEEDDKTPAEAARAPVPRGQSTILLAEDEAPVRAFAARALKLRGHTVIEADCGETALGLLADPGLRIDAILSDVIMPGIDGPTWVRQALVDRPGTRVVFMSGYAEESFAETQRLLKDAVFLPKPFSLRDLTETVDRLLS